MEVNGQLHEPAALFQGKVSDIDWIGGSANTRANLETAMKRKILAHAGNRIAVIQSVASFILEDMLSSLPLE
jgi:hypothetical protein